MKEGKRESRKEVKEKGSCEGKHPASQLVNQTARQPPSDRHLQSICIQ